MKHRLFPVQAKEKALLAQEWVIATWQLLKEEFQKAQAVGLAAYFEEVQQRFEAWRASRPEIARESADADDLAEDRRACVKGR